MVGNKANRRYEVLSPWAEADLKPIISHRVHRALRECYEEKLCVLSGLCEITMCG